MAELSKKEIHAITNRFYSCFCGTDIFEAESGVTFVCSESRNEELRGLGRRYTIYMLVKDDVCVVSYAPEYTDFFQKAAGNERRRSFDRNRGFFQSQENAADGIRSGARAGIR